MKKWLFFRTRKKSSLLSKQSKFFYKNKVRQIRFRVCIQIHRCIQFVVIINNKNSAKTKREIF